LSRAGKVALKHILNGVVMSEGSDSTHNPVFTSRDEYAVRFAGMQGFVAALAVLAALSACGVSYDGDESNKINGSIQVPVGKQSGPATTVNGSITIDDNAAVTSATTVNGGVHLGSQASAASLNSVNGDIVLSPGAHVSGSASSVNGELELGDGAEVLGSLSNVNGKITLTAAHVGRGIKTVNGDMTLTGASHVEGGILVEKPGTELLQITRKVPRIVIGPGVTVQGEMRFERTVKLYVSDKATIGTATGATPIPFSGDTPPN
jgi:acetyltransferase-like isoleucine patch superfamily enzyme